MKSFKETDIKLLVGWNSADLTEGGQRTILIAIRDVRKRLYAEGVCSKMERCDGAYLLAFKPDGDLLLHMKVSLQVARIKQVLAAAIAATTRSRLLRREPKIVVEQVHPVVSALLDDLDLGPRVVN